MPITRKRMIPKTTTAQYNYRAQVVKTAGIVGGGALAGTGLVVFGDDLARNTRAIVKAPGEGLGAGLRALFVGAGEGLGAGAAGAGGGIAKGALGLGLAAILIIGGFFLIRTAK